MTEGFDNFLCFLQGILEDGYLQKIFDEKLDAVRVARDKETIFEFDKLLHFHPHSEHQCTGIRNDAVDARQVVV